MKKILTTLCVSTFLGASFSSAHAAPTPQECGRIKQSLNTVNGSIIKYQRLIQAQHIPKNTAIDPSNRNPNSRHLAYVIGLEGDLDQELSDIWNRTNATTVDPDLKQLTAVEGQAYQLFSSIEHNQVTGNRTAGPDGTHWSPKAAEYQQIYKNHVGKLNQIIYQATVLLTKTCHI